jgi:hypothetical protein
MTRAPATAIDGPAQLRASPADSSPMVAKDSSPKYPPSKQSNLKPEPTTDVIPLRNPPTISSSAADLGPKTLWNEAYDILREEDSKLVDAYERDLLASQRPYEQGMLMMNTMKQIDLLGKGKREQTIT